jgi:hypothetical protein
MMVMKMKILKILAMLLLVGFVFSIASAFQVKVDSPVNVSNGIFEINISIAPEGETQFDIVELVPLSWQVVDWNSSSSVSMPEHRIMNYMGENLSAYRWKFVNANSNVSLVIKVKPSFEGDTLTTVWTYPNGFGSQSVSIKVNPVCGNGVCEPGETYSSCPSDCKALMSSKVGLMWILITLTLLTILGIAYREYKRLKRRKSVKKSKK